MLTSFNVLTPGNIRFGRGLARSAAPWLAARSAQILLIHGASLQRAAFLLSELHAHQLNVTTLSVAHEPDLQDIERGVRLAREKGVGAVVSLGGGAVIDAGKAIAALVPAQGPAIEYLEVVGTGRLLEANPLPFVAIPTTAGTGAEVTKNAVINVPEQQRKVSLRDDRMLPDLAIVDPSLTDNTPRAVTLASGLDALTQVIEPWLCARANPFTDALCREAIPRGIKALRTLMAKECPDSRDEMAWVSLCGGLALANAGLGVIHGLAGPLGGLSNAPTVRFAAACFPSAWRSMKRKLATNASASVLPTYASGWPPDWTPIRTAPGRACASGASDPVWAICASSASPAKRWNPRPSPPAAHPP